MKKRILPLSLVTLVIGLSAFLISATVTFPESFFSDPDNEITKEEIQSADHYIAKLRNNQHTNSVELEDIAKAYKQAKALEGTSSKEDFEWSFLGPDNVGGFTKAILYDNTDESYTTIIAGAFTGGLYKSTNSGQTWSKINGVENNLFVSCIAQASDGTIYAGTGGKLLGSGIYKSTDGENFVFLESTDPSMTGNAGFADVLEIAVNPNTGAVFAATTGGVYYSNDQGGSWNFAKSGETEFLIGNSTDVNIGSNGITAVSLDGLCYISEDGNPNTFVLHSSDTFNLPYEGVGGLELAIAPSNPDILYATVLGEEAELINIYISEDKGVNWRVVAPGNSPSLPLIFDFDNNVLTVFPEDPYKVLVGGSNLWEGEKFSETGYFQWLQRSSGQLPPEFFPSYVHTWHYKYVFKPGTNNEFLVGHNGGVSRGTAGMPYEFIELSKTYTTAQTMRVGISGNENFIIAGYNQAGVQLINGNGASGQEKNATQIWSFIPPWGGNGGESFLSIMDPEVAIYSALGANGGFVRSEDLGFSLANAFAAADMTYYTNYITPAIYWENFNNENSRDSVGINVKSSIPQGSDIYLFSSNRGYPFKYTADIAYEPGDTLIAKDIISTKFFWGSSEAIWMTTEALDFAVEPEWFTISSVDVGLEGDVMSMAISDDANFLYAGTFEGRLYRISNIALAYDYTRADVESPFCIISTTEIELIDPATGLQNTQSITSIAVDPQDANRVVVTCGNYGNSNYVYTSANGTADDALFQSIQGNLPQMPVYSSLIEMSTGMCIIGTEMGVYECQNIGAGTIEWNPSQGITGKVPVYDLVQQVVRQPEISIPYWDGVDTTIVTWPGTYNYGVIYAATYGRGIFKSDKYQKPVGIITHDLPEDLALKLNVFPNPVSTSATLEYELKQAGEVIISLYDINGRMMNSENISQKEGSHTYQINCNDFPRGMYIVKVQSGKVVNTSKFIVSR